MTVTALLVSHGGARWLPAVLDALAAQTRPPDRVVAVDTGSTDGGPALLADRLGPDAVLDLPPETGYGDAVRAGLAAAPGSEWVWLLHDDSAPAPDALAALLAAAEATPTADLLGPKLREWPSLRRLLEVGVTLSGTGHRETGLEPGEYDQGQHDRQRDVLAVNTAGLLVRREVLERLGGLDPALPLYGADLDLGWRAARAGHRTVVVPSAVVFHAEAATRGLRATHAVHGRPRRGLRQAALFILLANCATAVLPVQLVRLVVGSLLRALGLLLLRAPRPAYDEVAALVATLAAPRRLLAARAARRRSARVPPRDVRHLLPRPWVPYRHGLDLVGEVLAAVGSQAGEVAGARRTRRLQALETGPVPAEAQSLPPDTGLLARLLASPVALGFGALVVLAVVAGRGLYGRGLLAGGALLPAPDSAADWWRLHLERWHDVGVGSSLPAGPYLLPMALAGGLLLGKAWLVVDLVFWLAVPLAAAGGYRFLRALTPSRAAAGWGAAAYGLVPVLGGAVAQGRLGTVVAALVLPWLARAALGLAPGAGDADLRWRAAWRTALLLALLTAFVPVAWALALVLGLVAATAWAVTGAGRGRRVSAPVAAALLAVPVLLLPWTVPALAGRVPLLTEAGLPAADLLGGLTAWDVVLGRPAEVGAAPGWISAGVAVAALAALLRPDTRGRVLPAWAVLLVALAATVLLAGQAADVPGTEVGAAGPQPLWLGFPLLLAQAAAITAATLAGSGIAATLARSTFGWRQPLGVVVVGLAVATPAAGVVWWALAGSAGHLQRVPADPVPAYMAAAAAADPAQGVLLVRGDRGTVEYALLRGDGARLGDESVVAAPAAQTSLTSLVGALATGPQPEDVAALARHGVGFVYLSAPADVTLAGNLDAAGGLAPASTLRPGARAWQLEGEPSTTALPQPDGTALRPWLLAGQAAALLLAVVLAAPTRRVSR